MMKHTTIVAYLRLISVVLSISITTRATPATSYDHYLLSCGASITVNEIKSEYDGRTWQTDTNSTFAADFSSTIAASAIGPGLGSFSTARVFSTKFTYSFPVSPGPKFIRLFFYPSCSSYSNTSTGLSLPPENAYLTVQANSDHLLLRNFSAILSDTLLGNVVKKEFYVPVTGSLLQLTFNPTPPCTYAFVNGIEVVSVPENLYVGGSPQFPLVASSALENVYRLNVGGTEVSPLDDSGSMYRDWVNDQPYLIDNIVGLTGISAGTNISYTKTTPNYSAPAEVYQTFRMLGPVSNDVKSRVNLTWGFEVDLGFYYLLRLHWCELVANIKSGSFRVFDIYIDQQLAEEDVDIFAWTNSLNTPVFKDYVVYMDRGSHGNTSTGILNLALHPNTVAAHKYLDVLLNGMEIFKVNNSDGSLDAPNPQVSLHKTPPQQAPITKRPTRSNLLPCIIGGIAASVLVTLLACLLTFRCWKTKKESGTYRNMIDSSLLCRRFSLEQIMMATNNFSEDLIVGRGGFGNVYKGMVDADKEPLVVAIKRLNPSSKQGLREFLTEIALLSKHRHTHLVSLIGYCNESDEMILVYEYMERGTLREHLYNHKPDNPPLSWTQRLQACIGAAKGLQYLHSGQTHMIIHRDVKSTNILLDEKWVSKVSDFGISKLGPTGGDLSHVSTVVKGSFGYLDPEYYKTQRLTEKSDVHSFGVVLFEALCGRAALDPTLIKKHLNLALWAQSYQRKGAIDAIVDPNIKGEIAPVCLKVFGDIAERCVRKNGKDRPSMADVVTSLELALELQQQVSIIQIPA